MKLCPKQTRDPWVCLLLPIILCLVHTEASAQPSITIDFAEVVGTAGTPIATGQGAVNDSIPSSLVLDIKPVSLGVPWLQDLEPTDGTWERAAAAHATMIGLVWEEFGFRGRDHWADCPPDSDETASERKMTEWRDHVLLHVNRLMSDRVVGEDTLTVHYRIWNEPDLKDNWAPSPCFGDSDTLFYEMWRNAAEVIRQNDPRAIVVGPDFAGGVAGFDSTYKDGGGARRDSGIRMNGFLAYCLAHGCLPDVIEWHHIGLSDYRSEDDEPDSSKMNLYGQVAYARSLLSSLGVDPDSLKYGVAEMLDAGPGMTPGVLVRVFALAERSRQRGNGLLFAARASWCDPCQEDFESCNLEVTNTNYPKQWVRLGGLIHPCADTHQWQKRYAWWTYGAYAELDGEYVAVERSGSEFDAMASRKEGEVRVLLGRYQLLSGPDSLTVHLLNLNVVTNLIQGGIVQVEVERLRGGEGDLYTAPVSDEDLLSTSLSHRYVVDDQGSLSISLGDEAAFSELDAVSIVLSPPMFTSRTAAQ